MRVDRVGRDAWGKVVVSDNVTMVPRRSLSVSLAIVRLPRKKRMMVLLFLHDGRLALATSDHWTGAATGGQRWTDQSLGCASGRGREGERVGIGGG